MRYMIVHLGPFTSRARALNLSLDDIRKIELAIMRSPADFPLMPNTGGLQKLRFSPEKSSAGKSGGIRVCYFFMDSAHRIFLVTLFAKNEKGNLSRADQNTIAAWIKIIRAHHSEKNG